MEENLKENDILAKDLEKISRAVNFCIGCSEPFYFYDEKSAWYVGKDSYGYSVYSIAGYCENCGYESRDEVSMKVIERCS